MDNLKLLMSAESPLIDRTHCLGAERGKREVAKDQGQSLTSRLFCGEICHDDLRIAKAISRQKSLKSHLTTEYKTFFAMNFNVCFRRAISCA